MSLAVLAFLAGLLSVLAPCVLPILPVILWWSLWGGNRWKPIIIVSSTVICIVLFTILLKVSTLLLHVPEGFRTWFSAVVISAYGLTLVRPETRERIAQRAGLTKANELTQEAVAHKGIRGDILLGAALWPIFASCSPTYALLLSLIFPQSFSQGIVYTIIYALGFGLLLLVIAYGGRAIVKKLRRAVNPNGAFKKILGGVLILMGILIATGSIKSIEAYLVEHDFLNTARIESSLLEKSNVFQDETATAASSQKAQQRTENKDAPRANLLNTNYTAPELEGLSSRLNSNPFTLTQMKWKVVLIDFWTYSCINCIRTLPFLRERHKKYADKWLVILGVHTPEFQFEKLPKNVSKAIDKFGLTYAIAQDNDFETRRAFNNRYRPAKYIIDTEGNVRYTHFGEGEYAETEEVIQYLLKDVGSFAGDTNPPDPLPSPTENYTITSWVNGAETNEAETVDYSKIWTAETYLGTERRTLQKGNWPAAYVQYDPKTSQKNISNTRWISWKRSSEAEYIELESKENPDSSLPASAPDGSLFLNFEAKTAKLVMWTTDGKDVRVDVFVDGKIMQTLTVNAHELYTVFASDEYARHTIELRFQSGGVQAYAFTFG